MRRRFTLAQAEKALLEAWNYRALQEAYARYRFPAGSDEDRHLLSIFEERAARFAAEHFKYARAS
jgi:hypothetical protein